MLFKKGRLTGVPCIITHRQFSVVARVRPGVPLEVSSVKIAMDLREQLMQFQARFSITYSAPNFIIETASAAFQLHQLLACRVLDGEGFVLDLVPWCPEYVEQNLPWIIVHGVEGKIQTPLPKYICIGEISFSCPQLALQVQTQRSRQGHQNPTWPTLSANRSRYESMH
jgi:hypothetical protein